MNFKTLFLLSFILVLVACDNTPKDPKKRIVYEFEQAQEELVFIASVMPLVCIQDEIGIINEDLKNADINALETCTKVIDKYNESLADIKPHNPESEELKDYIDRNFTHSLNELKSDVKQTAEGIKKTKGGGLMGLLGGGLQTIGSGVSLGLTILKVQSAVSDFQQEFPSRYNNYVKSIEPRIKAFVDQAKAIEILPDAEKTALQSHFISTMSDQLDASLEKAGVSEKANCPNFEKQRKKIFGELEKVPMQEFWTEMAKFSADSLYISPKDLEFKK